MVAPLMPMPEASVHKNDSVVFGKNDIGLPNEPLIIDTISKSPSK